MYVYAYVYGCVYVLLVCICVCVCVRQWKKLCFSSAYTQKWTNKGRKVLFFLPTFRQSVSTVKMVLFSFIHSDSNNEQGYVLISSIHSDSETNKKKGFNFFHTSDSEIRMKERLFFFPPYS